MGRHLQLWSRTLVVYIASVTAVLAQLSPGELADVHAHLEGLSKCTECHVLGSKVSNDKCLGCHETIAGLIDDGRGLHAHADVKSQDCFACHSDHHGRKFDMVRFNQDDFDHDITGFVLEGRHRTVDCRQCHQPDLIAKPELSAREGTFLGLSNTCSGCHDDNHQGTLGSDCVACHDTDAFRPALGFDHSATDFALTGRHMEVECIECHEITEVGSQEMQQFAGTSFESCASCHEDAHGGRFGASCVDCHNTSSFNTIATNSFDHSMTGFELVGSHQPLDCAACHEPEASDGRAYRDFVHLDVINCTNCHTDVHEGRFGNDCASCHNQVSFAGGEPVDGFDHALTSFPLEGMHAAVACSQCHEGSKTEALPHSTCMECHTDQHNGQFDQPECSRCHTVEGFSPAEFGFVQHDATSFPLAGAHMATACVDCHLTAEEWQFRGLATTCVGCHGDTHEGQLDSSFYPGQSCTSCHIEEAWSQISFDHSVTAYALEGRHLSATCAGCHMPDDSPTVVFKGIQTACQQCHSDTHGGQFQGNVCSLCHQPRGWDLLTFSHDSTNFPLDGAHVSISCSQCHVVGLTESGFTTTIYRPTIAECAACHN